MKHIDLNPILSHTPQCTWASSNIYFSDDQILRQIGFVGTLDTDIFIQSSFTIKGKMLLNGAVIQTFTNDNMEHEKLVVYDIAMGKLRTRDVVTVHLEEPQPINIFTIKNIIATMPLISLIVFNLLIFILPPGIKDVLMWLGLGSLLIVGTVYAYMGFRFVKGMIREQKTAIAEKTIIYTNTEDMNLIQPAYIATLKDLVRFGITSAVFRGDHLYLKQLLQGTESEMQYYMNEAYTNLLSDFFAEVFTT